VHEAANEIATGTAESGRAGYAEWLALGAVVAGAVGAIVGSRRAGRHAWAPHGHPQAGPPAPAMLTAPHGDKLGAARE
jgi:hypothetical protein